MQKPRILVTGATGRTGRLVVAELLKAGHRVRAMAHRMDSRAVGLKSLGAEIIVTDMSDVESVSAALIDVQGAYYCPPFDPYMIQGAAAFAVAAKESRLEHIVGLTQWLSSPSHPALMTRQHWLADRMFSMVPGIAHTTIRPGFFAEAYLLPIALAAHLGMFPWIFGDSRNAPPSNEDIARVVVRALVDPLRHGGKTYRPTGPKLLGATEMATAIGLAVGRQVRALQTPAWLFIKSARQAGLSLDLLNALRYYISDHRLGAFELGAPTTDVLDVTGQPAEEFEAIARRYAARVENRPTLTNWLRTVGRFLIAPLQGGVNFESYMRELRSPVPSEPQFAPESKIWRREHGIHSEISTDSASRSAGRVISTESLS
jgi:NAD(P)H dehydrogenase (quinone)